MTTFQAHVPSAATPATPSPERAAVSDGPRLMAAAQAASALLREVQREIALHEDWAADLQQAVGGMTGEARTTQEALLAALGGRVETLRGRRARLEADLGRLQRPDLARAGDRATMEAFARLVEAYAPAATEPEMQGSRASDGPGEPFGLSGQSDGQPTGGADMPRSRRLPPIAQAEEFGRDRGRRRFVPNSTILRVAALIGFLALVLLAFGSKPSEMAEPGEEARFMASSGGSGLPQITSAPAGRAFPAGQFPMPGLPLPGMLQSVAPGAAPVLPGLPLQGGIQLDHLSEFLPKVLSVARQAL